MELGHFENGIQKQQHIINSAIKNSGVHISRDNNCFSTVGFTQLGWPELCINSEDKDLAEEMIYTVYLGIKQGIVDPFLNGKITGIFDQEIEVKPVTDDNKQCTFFDARNAYGDWNFKGVEIIL